MQRERRILIYGATGFTGRLITRAALHLDADLILAGRDGALVEAVARPLGLEWRAFALDPAAGIGAALADVGVVLNAAGPHADTAAPLIAGCLAAGAHYLDVAGELSVFVDAQRHDAEARRRQIMIMPGAGFWIVASDCLAAEAVRLAPGAKYLRMGCSSPGRLSVGSLKTVLRAAQGQIVARRAERLAAAPNGRMAWSFDFGEGARTSIGVTLPDVFTAYFTTGVPNIETYVEAGFLARALGPLGARMTAAAGAVGGAPLLELGLSEWAAAPSQVRPEPARQTLVVDVEDAWRRSRRIRLTTSDAYTFSADAATAILQRVIEGNFAPGFQTPGKLYGPELVFSIPNTRCETLDERSRGIA